MWRGSFIATSPTPCWSEYSTLTNRIFPGLHSIKMT
jgi:hypothetical protein